MRFVMRKTYTKGPGLTPQLIMKGKICPSCVWSQIHLPPIMRFLLFLTVVGCQTTEWINEMRATIGHSPLVCVQNLPDMGPTLPPTPHLAALSITTKLQKKTHLWNLPWQVGYSSFFDPKKYHYITQYCPPHEIWESKSDKKCHLFSNLSCQKIGQHKSIIVWSFHVLNYKKPF